MYTIKELELQVSDLIRECYPDEDNLRLTLTSVQFSGFSAISIVVGEPLTESDVTYIKSQLIVKHDHPKVGKHSNLVMGDLCVADSRRLALETAKRTLEQQYHGEDIPEHFKPNDYIYIYYIPKDNQNIFILDRSVGRGIVGLKRANELVDGHLCRGDEAFYTIGTLISKPALS